MGDVAAALVAWLSIYTYPVVVVAVLLGALGVPLPSTIVLLAAGSFVTDDGPNIFVLFGTALAAAVTGDVACFSLARWAGGHVVGRFGARVGVTAERVAAAERRFERWGGLLVLVTRFLLTGLALPTNLVAGGSGYPLVRFFGFALMGEAIWAAQFLTLGWLFGPSWVSLLDYLNDAATTLTTLALAGGLVYLLVRVLRAPPAQSAQDDEVAPTPDE